MMRAVAISPANKPGIRTIDPETGRIKNGNGTFAHKPGEHYSKPGRIVNWKSIHQLILWMDVAGMSKADIAAQIKYNPQTIRAIIGSPLYQVQKQQLYETLQTSGLQGILERIRVDAPKNIEFLIKARDTDEIKMGHRMAAAKQLSREVDRVYPRTTKHVEDRVVRITIDGQKLSRLTSALQEMGAPIDAELIEGVQNAPTEGAPPLSGKSIEQLMAELRAAEPE